MKKHKELEEILYRLVNDSSPMPPIKGFVNRALADITSLIDREVKAELEELVKEGDSMSNIPERNDGYIGEFARDRLKELEESVE